MLRPVGLLRLLSASLGGRSAPWLAVVVVAMVLLAPALGHAADPAPEPAASSTDPGSPASSTTGWSTIVGASLGVLFGALLAAWQIRGMKRDA
jgi:hypothetical protein